MGVKKGNEYEFWKTLTDFVGFSTLVETVPRLYPPLDSRVRGNDVVDSRTLVVRENDFFMR